MQDIPGIQNIVAVGSGKGGVGKTTMSVNLAIALSRLGNRVGLLDADVYGPNVPLMMGVSEAPLTDGQRIRPLIKEGLRIMSMGFLNPGDKPLVWRGPMLHNVMVQFLRQVDWGELDYHRLASWHGRCAIEPDAIDQVDRRCCCHDTERREP